MLRQFEQVRILLANIKNNSLAFERENEELRKAYTQLKNDYDKMKHDYDECKRNLEKTSREIPNSQS